MASNGDTRVCAGDCFGILSTLMAVETRIPGNRAVLEWHPSASMSGTGGSGAKLRWRGATRFGSSTPEKP